MNKAFIFPGQGSQVVGMGKELYDNFNCAKEVFEEVNEALNQKLSKIIFEGPIEDLTLTENTQPALMAVSMAVMNVLEREFNLDLAKACSYIAGHSLGEYSALAAGKAISIADTAKLVKTRGKAMQEAVPVGEGAMIAVLGAEIEQINEIIGKAAEDKICQIANDNSPGQIVVSGSSVAIERAIALFGAAGKKAIKLPVSAPFHSKLMMPAQEVMQNALANTVIRKPLVQIINNVSATPTDDPERIRKLLVEQVSGMVRWRETILLLREKNINMTVEIGAGKVLTGLTKRIDKEMQSISLQTIQDIEEFAKNYLA